MSRRIPNSVGTVIIVVALFAALIGGWIYMRDSDPVNIFSASAQELGDKIKKDPAHKQQYISEYVAQMMAKGKKSQQEAAAKAAAQAGSK